MQSQAGRQADSSQAAAGQGGDEAPTRPNDSALQQANPYRSLGDAMQQWQRRLGITIDAAAAPEAEPPGGGDANNEGAEQEQGNGPHQYVSQNERRQAGDTQALGPATEEQAQEAAAVADEIQGAGQDNDEQMVEAAEDALDEEMLSPEDAAAAESKMLQGSRQQAAAANPQARLKGEEDGGEDKEGSEGQDAEAVDLDKAQVQQDAAATDSFVAALMERSSLESPTGAGQKLCILHCFRTQTSLQTLTVLGALCHSQSVHCTCSHCELHGCVANVA